MPQKLDPQAQIIRLKAENRELRRRLRQLNAAFHAEMTETLAEACAAHYERIKTAREFDRLTLAMLACLDESAATPH